MIDYALRVPDEQLDRFLEIFGIHALNGGTFSIVNTKLLDQGSKVIYSDIFSDHCSCKSKNKCRNNLVMIFSNN